MPSRVLAFIRRIVIPGNAPEPPVIDRNVPGAFAIFMDEDEQEILYAKRWPFLGVPNDERTNSTTWLIEGQVFGPSRRDEQGNWIFRRCAR